jgi:hypothetical protein
MLKKRLLVLVALLCLLLVFSDAKPVDAEAYCSCALTCNGGNATCGATCEGDSLTDIIRATRACCKAAQESTPLNCTGEGGGGT